MGEREEFLISALPLPIPSFAGSAREHAFFRELLLPLSRDVVLAAAP
jgi:hypothetical protein